MTTALLPEPSSRHATCAWCDRTFTSIVELLDHVDAGHLDVAPPEPSLQPAPADRLAA